MNRPAAFTDKSLARLQAVGVGVEQLAEATALLAGSFAAGRKVLLFGNGGSAADAQHMATEFLGRFRLERKPLPAVALTTNTSALTAIGNDFGFERVFSRQLQALGRRGDVAIAISTSGASPNVLEAVRAARMAGMRSIGLVGREDSPLEELVDVPIVVASASADEAQEAFLAAEHALCAGVEATLFGPQAEPSRPPEQPIADDGKIVGWDQLLTLRDHWRAEGLKVVWTNGCFELLHAGHVLSLRAARRLGDVLVVGVNGDESVRRMKGKGRPLVPAAHRVEVVAGLEAVDYLVVLEEWTPGSAIGRLEPEVVCMGADSASRPAPEAEVVRSYGGSLVMLPLVPGFSTSELARRLGNGSR